MQPVVNFINQIGNIGGLIGLGWAAWGAWDLAIGLSSLGSEQEGEQWTNPPSIS